MRQGQRFNLIVLALIGLILFGCSSLDDSINAQATPTPTPTASPTATALPTPTATQEPTAAPSYLQSLSCAEVLRYDEAALRDLDDPYDEYTNMALVLNRMTNDSYDIGYGEVRARVLECAANTPGYAYMLEQPCEEVLYIHSVGQETAQATAQTQEELQGLSYVLAGIGYSTETDYDPLVSTRDMVMRVTQCEGEG